jgi:hypothetical protein
MRFASEWLEVSAIFPPFISEAPSSDTGIIIVVPCFNEPGIIFTLESLNKCQKPKCDTEVIIVINSPRDSGKEILERNRITLLEMDTWNKKTRPFFRLYSILIENPEIKGWGVGLARKTGMDEALRRFNHVEKPGGIILCLDADCTVSSGYLLSVYNELLLDKDRKGCVIHYEHPLSGRDYPEEVYNAVLQYELHLRYYFLALRYSGFPYVFHTVGSTIAVKALAYLKGGGMNRRQAGEDFYFVQKMVSSGRWHTIYSATVYPSPRVSDRVPFGTGLAVGKMVRKGEKVFMTYNPSAFEDLKCFLNLCRSVFIENNRFHAKIYNELPESFKTFLPGSDWQMKLEEIAGNSSGIDSFNKRLYQWFNMFRVVKYLNSVHENLYQRITASEASRIILKMSGIEIPESSDSELLIFLRDREKVLSYSPS